MADRTQIHFSALALTRILGAVALLAVGAVHYQQYEYNFYSTAPTIGPLFLFNFIAATGLGLWLLAGPLIRLGRLRLALDRLAALGGIAVSAGALVALLISEYTPLFGFRESGYRTAIVLAIAFEAVAVVLLALYLWGTRHHTRRSQARGMQTPSPEPR